VQEPKEIKEAMIEFYSILYLESELWRPSFDVEGCPIISVEENEWLQTPFTEAKVVQIIKQCEKAYDCQLEFLPKKSVGHGIWQ